MFMQVYNNEPRGPARRQRPHDHRHRRATSTARSRPAGPTPSPTAAGSVPGKGQLPAPDTVAAYGPTQGALLLYKIQVVSLDNRPLELKIVDPDDPLADGLGRARRLALAQAGLEHLPRHWRRRVAAGAVVHQQHAHHDAWVQCRGEGREPGVGVARFGSAGLRIRSCSASASDSPDSLASCDAACAALFSSAVPVLPATVTPGIAAEVPVP